ncbi:MAG TPA: carboxy terminal-processing peptidase [Cytophagaceae bacterium]
MYHFIRLVLIIIFPLAIALSSKGQSIRDEANTIAKVLSKTHYQPRELNDQLSEELYKNFLNYLDPKNLYFTDKEVKQLSIYKHQLDDELKGAFWAFLPQATILFKQRLIATDKVIDELLAKPLNYSSTDVLTLSKTDSFKFASDEASHKSKWNKWLRYKILLKLVSAGDSSISDAELLKKEPEIREKIRSIEKRKIKKLLEHPNGFENYVASIYFNALLHCYDPHSNYFSKADMENFKSQLSPEAYSFGMEVEETEEGDIKIVRLYPGGPAWKSNELHKGDLLLQLKWEGKEAIELTGAELAEVQRILSESIIGKMEFTVKKTDGTVKTVTLIKEKIQADENIVRSFILKGSKKIGYISLPGFYTEWENASGLGCSNDVAKEIVKLKQEGIEGLILDIRYNGGGSLQEGLNLAGIFINEGPLFMLQSKDKKPYAMKDPNRGTIYDGPLVVMVNGQSASASEVLASTLQDYNRALIVGSPTYGKATGQIILPVDTTVNINSPNFSASNSRYGYLTVTIHKLYRITGKSAQIKGVTPDVYLPDIYETIDYRESIYPTALPYDSVVKKIYYTPLAKLPVDPISVNSKTRINNQEEFTAIQQVINLKLKEKATTNTYPLNLKDLRVKMQKEDKWQNLLSKILYIDSNNSLYQVENTLLEKELLKMDTYTKEVNDALKQNIQNDIYIGETFQIINELINLTN